MPTHAKVGVTQNYDGEDVSALLIEVLHGSKKCDVTNRKYAIL